MSRERCTRYARRRDAATPGLRAALEAAASELADRIEAGQSAMVSVSYGGRWLSWQAVHTRALQLVSERRRARAQEGEGA